MQRIMRILIVAVLLVGFAASYAAAPAAAAPGGPNSDQQTTTGVDNTRAIVQLKGDPLSTYVKTKPPQGKKIDFNQSTVKSYRAQLSALRNDFKSWLRANAPKAKVTSEYDISLNAVAISLNGETLQKIAGAPMVVQAQYEGLYVPTQDTKVDDIDLALISAKQAWALNGGADNAGAGVKVAIIDTGIDITHPCFSDAGYADQAKLGDKNFTNNKVIVAKVFNMKTPSMHYTPEALQEHGTHVAGTVACNANTPAVVDGVSLYPMSGVAPKALLGNYNIFPGDVTNAHSEDILNALEAAYADGFDVANMSLGGSSAGIQDLVSMAVDDLDQANMVVAVAAGNSGPGHYTVESPGRAARALTAGASTVPHFVAAPVIVSGTRYAGMPGDFGLVDSDLTAPLAVVMDGASLSKACAALPDLTGKIALLSRGDCSFSTKIRNARTAHAAAVVMVNNVPGDPIGMGQDGTPDQPTSVPAYMVSIDDKDALMAQDGKDATIAAAMSYFTSKYGDIMADFSSQGPTDVDFRVKPDVVAPGVNVVSSIPHQFCTAAPCFAFFQGTSMATPHLAGSAALVKSQHPTWSAAQIRSAIVNTADQGKLMKSTAVTELQKDVNVIGAGRENLLSAVQAAVALDPVSVSFGAIPSGSGQARSFTVTLTNLTGDPKTFSLGVASTTGAGVAFGVSPAAVNVAAGQSATFTVTMSADKGAGMGDHQATLTVKDGGVEVAHAVVYTIIK